MKLVVMEIFWLSQPYLWLLVAQTSCWWTLWPCGYTELQFSNSSHMYQNMVSQNILVLVDWATGSESGLQSKWCLISSFTLASWILVFSIMPCALVYSILPLYTHGYLVDVQPCTLVSMQICFPFLPHMNICLMACCIVSVAKQTSLLFAYPETW